MDIDFTYYLMNLTFVTLFLVLVVIAKWVYNLTAPYNTFTEITENKNQALAVSIAGFIAALSMIYVAVLVGPSNGFKTDLINVSIYAGLGLVLLLISRLINDKLLLHKFCNHNQLVEHQSLSVGLVQASSYITSGLIIAGALMGEGSLISALAFYVLAQFMLIVFSKAYDIVTKFDLHDELEKNNTAAAISFACTKIAIGIILFHSLQGAFVSWQESITLFFVDAAIAFVLLPIVRLVVDKLLLTAIRIDDAIAENNSAIALIEGFVAISVALVILFSL